MRNKVLKIMGTVLLSGVLLMGCQVPGAGDGGEGESELPLLVYCQVKDISAVFWQGAILGCQQAADELGADKIELRFTTGTTDMGIEDSIKAFEDALSAGADGIVIAPADSVALIPAVEEANALGIPVVAIIG